MGMSMYQGKILEYVSKDDAIHPNTKVTYTDQRGRQAEINIKELLKLAKKSKKELNKRLVYDIENGGLHIGFPIIDALNDLSNEFGADLVISKVAKEIKNDSR